MNLPIHVKHRLNALAGLAVLLLSTPVVIAHGVHNEAPWTACSAQERNASCSYSDGHGDLYRGSCQLFSDKLMCVRNQPIVRQADLASDPAEHPPASAHE